MKIKSKETPDVPQRIKPRLTSCEYATQPSLIKNLEWQPNGKIKQGKKSARVFKARNFIWNGRKEADNNLWQLDQQWSQGEWTTNTDLLRYVNMWLIYQRPYYPLYRCERL